MQGHTPILSRWGLALFLAFAGGCAQMSPAPAPDPAPEIKQAHAVRTASPPLVLREARRIRRVEVTALVDARAATSMNSSRSAVSRAASLGRYRTSVPRWNW